MNPFAQLIDRAVPERLLPTRIHDDAPIMKTSAAKRIELAQREFKPEREQQRTARRRRALYLFVLGYFERNDQLPNGAVVAKELGVHPTTGYDYLRALAREGVIERNEAGHWRFVRGRDDDLHERLKAADARFRVRNHRKLARGGAA